MDDEQLLNSLSGASAFKTTSSKVPLKEGLEGAAQFKQPQQQPQKPSPTDSNKK